MALDIFTDIPASWSAAAWALGSVPLQHLLLGLPQSSSCVASEFQHLCDAPCSGEQRKTPEGTHSVIAVYAIDHMDPSRDLVPTATIQVG